MDLKKYSTEKLIEAKEIIDRMMLEGSDTQRDVILYGYLREELKRRQVKLDWLLEVTIKER